MQRFMLFLGHPIYALAVVLATLLGASGSGQRAVGAARAPAAARAASCAAAITALAAVLLVYAFALGPLFHALIGLVLPLRIAIAAALVLVPGLFMGTLLPMGVRSANALGPEVVPWAWGLNGATSVVGSILAITLSMNYGFTTTLLVGILIYSLATFALPLTAASASPSVEAPSRAA